MKDVKIKLTFHRVHKIGPGGVVTANQKYQLVQMENAVTARVANPEAGAWSVYRVGDVVSEDHVQEFVADKRFYEVKVKS